MQFIYQNRVHCGYLENYLEDAKKAMKTEENNGNEEERQEIIAKVQELYNLAECGKSSDEAREKFKRSANPDDGTGQKGIVICS